jgi:hypothetical protein
MGKLLLILVLAWTAIDEMASSRSEPPLLIDSPQALDAGD